ncbi:hypothetical protein MHYP_G00208800 [Metynnis hypsauchen]
MACIPWGLAVASAGCLQCWCGDCTHPGTLMELQMATCSWVSAAIPSHTCWRAWLL